jgi:mRNA-degrading endonuclease RelE of RelBE toxin-antitoxin system
MNSDTIKRELIFSPEYAEFVQNTSPRTREKLRYAIAILKSVPHIPTKFVKKLVNTDFYELRVSVDNEVRVILFAADNDNINLATNIVLLNGFTKKSTKDYNREITKAINILRGVL